MTYVASDLEPRCVGCGKLLAEKVSRPWVIRCVRCKHRNNSEDRRIPSSIIMETSTQTN